MFGREHIEEAEEARLAAYASRASRSRGRKHGWLGTDPYRTDFQRDRDRILYSTAFRRLKYKTQVYVVQEADFYRTRLTHSLEVMQHARTLARALGCNEDLVEAISYAHDLGHAPFGHLAEERLARLMEPHGGFDHNRQGLRVVDRLERIYPEHPGLDLCWETREGLARHRTEYDREAEVGEFAAWPQPSVECQIVNLADQLAFVTHDLDDALSGRLIGEEHLVRKGLELVREILDRRRGESRREGQEIGSRERRLLIRDLIHDLSVDAITQSQQLLAQSGARTPDDVRRRRQPVVAFSPEMERHVGRLNAFLMGEVYHHPWVLMMGKKGVRMVEDLFHAFMEDPRLLPRHVTEDLDPGKRGSLARTVTDYVASMTDRAAHNLHRAIFDPGERIFPGI